MFQKSLLSLFVISSLFGESTKETFTEPQLPKAEEYTILENCNMEKEMVGIFINQHPMDTFKLEYEVIANTKLSELENLSVLQKKGSNIMVGGIVTKVDYLITKTGKQYSKFTIQDFEGQFTFFNFNTSYDLLRPILYENQFLLIKCKIEKPKWGDKDWEMNIVSAMKMEDVKERFFNGIEVKLFLKNITQALLKELELIFKKYEGRYPLNVSLIDQQKKYTINMYSSDKRIDICQELINDLKQLEINNKIITSSLN